MITIQAAGSLKERIPADLTVPTARTVGEAVAQLPIPPDVGLVMMINGRLAHWNSELNDGDVLRLAPVVGGG
ncbi:MAG: MoaD/ThiS family protein [Caldilineales bacterium]|nr:MoaD/ThiS family protein [Caldilineales bacterium]MCW5860434.1 MoaD/ThiS family protein [Caldilineales bacterium]